MEEITSVTLEAVCAAFKRAANTIKNDNKGQMYPVHVEKNWELKYDSESNKFTLNIHYYDGNAERQVYTAIVE